MADRMMGCVLQGAHILCWEQYAVEDLKYRILYNEAGVSVI